MTTYNRKTLGQLCNRLTYGCWDLKGAHYSGAVGWIVEEVGDEVEGAQSVGVGYEAGDLLDDQEDEKGYYRAEAVVDLVILGAVHWGFRYEVKEDLA